MVLDRPLTTSKPLTSTKPGVYDDVGEVLGARLQLDGGVANGDSGDNVYDDVDAGDEQKIRYVCEGCG